MEKIYLPVIAEEDYEAFRSIMHSELPPSYSEWRERHATRVAYWSKTHQIVEVDVKPTGFGEFIHKNGRAGDQRALIDFAARMSERPNR
jgi:hypothetical protein